VCLTQSLGPLLDSVPHKRWGHVYDLTVHANLVCFKIAPEVLNWKSFVYHIPAAHDPLLSQHIGTNCTYLEWQSPVVFKAGSRDLQHGHHLETCLDSQLSPIPTELEILGWGSATCFNKPRSFTLHVTFQDSLLYLVPLALLVVRHTVLRLSQGSCWPGGTVEGLVYAQPTRGPPHQVYHHRWQSFTWSWSDKHKAWAFSLLCPSHVSVPKHPMCVLWCLRSPSVLGGLWWHRLFISWPCSVI
jgi:hypothetical protein